MCCLLCDWLLDLLVGWLVDCLIVRYIIHFHSSFAVVWKWMWCINLGHVVFFLEKFSKLLIAKVTVMINLAADCLNRLQCFYVSQTQSHICLVSCSWVCLTGSLDKSSCSCAIDCSGCIWAMTQAPGAPNVMASLKVLFSPGAVQLVH